MPNISDYQDETEKFAVANPDTRKSENEMPKQNDNIIPVLAAIILNEKGQVLLAQRKPGLSQALKWEFPGGKLKAGETPADCLKREIREELGLEIEIRRIFGAVNHSYSDKNIVLIAYFAELISGDMRLKDHQQVKWVDIDDLNEYELSPADIPFVDLLVSQWAKD